MIRLVVFLISGQGYFTFPYGYAKHNWGRGRKEEQTIGLGLAPNARAGEGSLWHFCAAFREFAGYRGRVFTQNFEKASRTHFLALVNPASVGQQVLVAAFLNSVDWSPLCPTLISWLTCSVDWSLLLPSADCPSLFSGTFLPSSSSGLVGDLTHKTFVWVSRQNRQRDCLTGTLTHPHNECPTSCHTNTLRKILYNVPFYDPHGNIYF